jgi:hypothetical protein
MVIVDRNQPTARRKPQGQSRPHASANPLASFASMNCIVKSLREAFRNAFELDTFPVRKPPEIPTGFAGGQAALDARRKSFLIECLENGLRVVQPMTLMTMGLYNEPAGAYVPSILY